MGLTSYDAATLCGWISIAWLAGDLANLIGAIWQGLLPTMIILALYYSLCDIILLSQIHWYRFLRRRYPDRFTSIDADIPTEETSLLGSNKENPKKFYEREDFKKVTEYVLAFGFVICVGVAAWKLNMKDGEGGRPELGEEKWDLKAQVFGWISAFLYLGSRIPQIAKNRETKCEGLSLMMFGFAIIGNVTYVLSILLQSLSFHHLWVNLSWLIGSGGTIGLDMIVLCQFFWYRKERNGIDKLLKDGDDEIA